MNQFKGKITFESIKGRGSEFSFTFKLDPKSAKNSSLAIKKSSVEEMQINTTQLYFLWKPPGVLDSDSLNYVEKLNLNDGMAQNSMAYICSFGYSLPVRKFDKSRKRNISFIYQEARAKALDHEARILSVDD